LRRLFCRWHPALCSTNALVYGFELDAWDVLKACRAELEPIDDDDEVTVRLDLLHLLAHPFSEHDKPT
jgi:hypothetical protein